MVEKIAGFDVYVDPNFRPIGAVGLLGKTKLLPLIMTFYTYRSTYDGPDYRDVDGPVGILRQFIDVYECDEETGERRLVDRTGTGLMFEVVEMTTARGHAFKTVREIV